MRDVLVNTAWLGEQIANLFGDRFDLSCAQGETVPGTAGSGIRMHYSDEGRDFGGALETAGGIVRALPQLADPFWVLAGDVFVPGSEFSQVDVDDFRASGKLAQIWLVPNPSHNPDGDFGLSDAGLATNQGTPALPTAPSACTAMPFLHCRTATLLRAIHKAARRRWRRYCELR